MPSKRRQNHPQPAIQSDYDTESAAIPALSEAPKRTIAELNHSVLKRYVPGLQRIVSTASFTVVYVFSPESEQWEKSGVEGTLFLCQTLQASSTGYSVVILNRKSLDNFVTHLTSADDVELTDEYVILQGEGADGTPRIYGLWIFSEAGSVPSTKELVGLSIQECAMRLDQAEDIAEEDHDAQPFEGNPPQPAHQIVSSVPTFGQSIDLATLFAKPQIQRETHIEPPAAPPADIQTGRRIDLMQLFGQPQVQAESHIGTGQASVLNDPPPASRSSRSQPQVKQNALLNLFKTGG